MLCQQYSIGKQFKTWLAQTNQRKKTTTNALLFWDIDISEVLHADPCS